MMTTTHEFRFAFFLFLVMTLLSEVLLAQHENRASTELQRINEEIYREKPGYKLINWSLLSFDKVNGTKSEFFNGRYESQNLDLHGSIFFIASPIYGTAMARSLNSLLLGYEQAGKIWWITDTRLPGRGGEVWAIMDLNADSFPEVVCVTEIGPLPAPDWLEMWIFGWNGNAWNQLNLSIEENGGSLISGPEARFQLIGPDSKGLFKILYIGSDGSRLFEWNGSEFALIEEQ